MGEFLDFVANLGFPIAVTAFLLVKVDKTLEGLKKSIEDLSLVLRKNL